MGNLPTVLCIHMCTHCNCVHIVIFLWSAWSNIWSCNILLKENFKDFTKKNHVGFFFEVLFFPNCIFFVKLTNCIGQVFPVKSFELQASNLKICMNKFLLSMYHFRKTYKPCLFIHTFTFITKILRG